MIIMNNYTEVIEFVKEQIDYDYLLKYEKLDTDLLDCVVILIAETYMLREFVDDGYSGGNFDRPGFKAMLEHIEKEKIGMVITKDLSRLGRDLTESSRYAEEYFPEHDVLYIAVTGPFPGSGSDAAVPFFRREKITGYFFVLPLHNKNAVRFPEDGAKARSRRGSR